jgi:hypothetical protein
MKKLMQWRRVGEDLVLFLQESEEWQRYDKTKYYQADISLPGLKPSKGFRTSQKLLNQGWTFIPSEN